MEILKKQAADEIEQDENNMMYAIYEIEGYTKKRSKLGDSSSSQIWETPGMIGQSDPVNFAQYAQKHELLDVAGWE